MTSAVRLRVPSRARAASPPPAWRRVLVVVGLLAAAFAVVAAWATAAHPGASPDDDYHLASIWCPDQLDLCPQRVTADGVHEVQVAAAVALPATCFQGDWTQSGACSEAFGAEPVWTDRVDAGEYPGGFYLAMHVLAGPDVTNSVFAMRIANGVVAIGVIGGALALLTAGNRRMVALAGIVALGPMPLHLIASTNPSSWAITGVTATFAGLHGFLTERASPTWRRGSLLGIAGIGAVMAAGSRPDSGAFIALVALVVVVLHFDVMRSNWRLVIPSAVAIVIGVTGFLLGAVGAQTAGEMTTQGSGGGAPLFIYNILHLPTLLIDSVVGDLNWLDTWLPPLTRMSIVLVAAGIVFQGLRAMDGHKALAFGGLAFSVAALPLLLLQAWNVSVGQMVQGRYVTPLIPVLLMVAVWNPRHRTVEPLSRAQSAILMIALSGAHLLALHWQIRRFVTGLDVTHPNLDANAEWWASPVSPMITWVLGSLGFAILVCTSVRLLHSGTPNPLVIRRWSRWTIQNRRRTTAAPRQALPGRTQESVVSSC